MTNDSTLIGDELLDKLVMLCMNAPFMKHMRMHYAEHVGSKQPFGMRVVRDSDQIFNKYFKVVQMSLSLICCCLELSLHFFLALQFPYEPGGDQNSCAEQCDPVQISLAQSAPLSENLLQSIAIGYNRRLQLGPSQLQSSTKFIDCNQRLLRNL